MPSTIPHEELIFAPLDTVVVGSRVLIMDQVTSTNDHALRLGGQGTVIIADRQTAGRGRHGRSWHSLPGCGLWLSVAFEQPIEGLEFAAPLAVRDAARRWCSLDLKWPNDVLLQAKKVAGIMVERRQGRTALGIGINVKHRPEEFPPELQAKATSIEVGAGCACERAELLHALLTALDRRVVVLLEGGMDAILREWADACAVQGRRARSGPVEGTVETVDETGALIVTTPQGPRRIVFGEIVEMNGTD